MKSQHIQEEEVPCVWDRQATASKTSKTFGGDSATPGFEVWNPFDAQHCVDFIEEEEILLEKPSTQGQIYYYHNPVPEELLWQQKIAEEMLDAGSIAYFQEEEQLFAEKMSLKRFSCCV